MLRVTQSNRLETLAARLAVALDVARDDPLVPDLVVVPNHGMARWLSLGLAREHGICANVRFALPAELVWDVLGRIVGPRAETDLFDPAVLTWRVLGALDGLEPGPRIAALQAYLEGSSDRSRYELARRIAGVFDQYLVYRPDWIRRWEAGGEVHWQAELWRRLVAARPGATHRVHLLDELVAALGRGALTRAGLAERLFLFGIPAMPPAHLAVFGRLAAQMDLDAYVLAPSREYASGLVTERQRARAPDPERAHLEVGNPLVAALGRQGAEFRDLLVEWDPHTIDAWIEPDEATILGALQADMHHLRHRGTDEFPATPRADDGSVQVHACHGVMREVEILHDQLLALFDRDPTLSPSDVVVMTPDIEAYAPCIEAVFRTAPPERAIAYTIADRSVRAERPLVDAFLALLELPASRYDAHRLLALLDVDAIRRRFEFTETDVARARRWTREAGVRWGVDATARAALGLPATIEHTWRFGLDRLLLGYAVPGNARRHLAGIVPFDDVEGTAARTVGLLASFAEACFALRAELDGARPPAEWAVVLGQLLDRFFAAAGIDEEDVATVRRALGQLETLTARAGFAGGISRDLVRAHLEGALAAPLATGRFLAGKVSFCALVPMRSIPFAVVCLLGMNDGGFPRPRRPLGFDLMADDFKLGDRSRREDDRSLFLEAILSARRVLYLSYAGADIRDNAELPPSVLVADLARYVQEGFGVDVVRKHPLQPFDARYFSGDPVLVSHAEDLCRARKRQGSRAEPEAPFIQRPLPEGEAAWRTIAIDDLVHFFRGPARFLLRERLGLRLEPARGEVETREPFVPDALERYRVRDEVVRLWRAKVPREEIAPLLRGAGLLPHGVLGDVVLAEAAQTVGDLVARVEAVLPDGPPSPVGIDVVLGDGFRVHGALVPSRLGGVADYRVSASMAKDRVGLWVRHVVLACGPTGGGESRFFGTGGDIVLAPVAGPRDILASLVALYWDGLHRPLPFFPATSYEAARGKDPWKEWRGTPTPNAPPKEGEDAYNVLAFRGGEPLGGDFEAIARAFFTPLIAHQTETKP
jgi:exodeoxyribonuclease V gamma subunit